MFTIYDAIIMKLWQRVADLVAAHLFFKGKAESLHENLGYILAKFCYVQCANQHKRQWSIRKWVVSFSCINVSWVVQFQKSVRKLVRTKGSLFAFQRLIMKSVAFALPAT